MSKIHNGFLMIFGLVWAFFSPNNWRYALTGQTKVRVYLKSGAHIDVWCTRWKGNTRPGEKSYSFTNTRYTTAIDPAEIVAFVECR